jgi:hypothetical protein
MRHRFLMCVAMAATLLALSAAPSPGWALGRYAEGAAPPAETSKETPKETPRETPKDTPKDSSKENPPSPSGPEPPSAAVLDPTTVQSVMGREVRSVVDENMGRIVDVIVDRSGKVRAAVIDFGGFLGVGSRKIAVDWGILNFGSGDKSDRVVADLTRAQVKAAPEYKDGKPVVVLGAAPEAPQAAEPGPAPR